MREDIQVVQEHSRIYLMLCSLCVFLSSTGTRVLRCVNYNILLLVWLKETLERTVGGINIQVGVETNIPDQQDTTLKEGLSCLSLH